ncbi:MAG TPA: hypothetical protein VIP53_07565, partial [Nitrososphaera sp.]
LPSTRRYKVVNPYAICHKMKKQYGWGSHEKWQRCVDGIKKTNKRKRKSWLCIERPDNPLQIVFL